jgi:hypothetical protein
MLAAVDWAREREGDRTPLRLQDLADHYAAKKNLPHVMVRSTARELVKERLGVMLRFEIADLSADSIDCSPNVTK